MLQQALDNPGSTRYIIKAEVREVGDVEYSQKSGKPFQRIQLNDSQIQRQIKIFQGKGQPLTQQHIGQKEQFSISGYVSTFDNNVYLSGFWQAQGQQQAPPQRQATQQPQQAQRPPQQAAQATNAAASNRNTSIERQAAFKAACEYAGRRDLDPNTLIEAARAGHYFIETGNNILKVPNPDKEITNPGYVGDDPPPPPEDNIPF